MTPSQPPKYLYKYCSAARATQILQDLSLYLASSTQLNDLFEFRFRSLLTETSDGKLKASAKRLIAEGIKEDIKSATERAGNQATLRGDLFYGRGKQSADVGYLRG